MKKTQTFDTYFHTQITTLNHRKQNQTFVFIFFSMLEIRNPEFTWDSTASSPKRNAVGNALFPTNAVARAEPNVVICVISHTHKEQR